jgi:hypothetical protein
MLFACGNNMLARFSLDCCGIIQGEDIVDIDSREVRLGQRTRGAEKRKSGYSSSHIFGRCMCS